MRIVPRSSKPITVTLGDMHPGVEARVRSGRYASASEVMRAALRALDREEAALDDWLRQKVEDAYADPRPDIPSEDVFAGLRQRYAGGIKAGKDGGS